MKKQMTWEYIVDEATSTEGMKIKQRLQFHYFNPNGVTAEKKRLDDQIRNLVDSGKVPSGWHLAYGTFNDYYYKALNKLVRQKQPSGYDVNSAIRRQKEENEKIAQKIKEVQ